jgi:hypothetical protein
MNAVPEQPAEGALLFIYAADSGLFNTVADIAHKIFSPQTYQCQLCALTHGYFKVRKPWQDFIESLAVPCHFLHRDEASGIPGIDTQHHPAIYQWQQDQWQLCLDQNAITACQSLAELMDAIRLSCTPK